MATQLNYDQLGPLVTSELSPALFINNYNALAYFRNFPISGGIVKIAAIIAVPVLLAAGYWLFVVNGPTPVVKARIDDAGTDSIDSILDL